LHEVAEEYLVYDFPGKVKIQHGPFHDAKVEPVYVPKCIVREVKSDDAHEDGDDQKQDRCWEEANNLKRAGNGGKLEMFSRQHIEVHDIDGVLHVSGPAIW
jgi:hypothetical protein